MNKYLNNKNKIEEQETKTTFKEFLNDNDFIIDNNKTKSNKKPPTKPKQKINTSVIKNNFNNNTNKIDLEIEREKEQKTKRINLKLKPSIYNKLVNDTKLNKNKNITEYITELIIQGKENK